MWYIKNGEAKRIGWNELFYIDYEVYKWRSMSRGKINYKVLH